MFLPRKRFAAVALTLLAGGWNSFADAPQAFKWSVQYLIDNSQSVFGRPQEVYPRGIRGIGVSPDGNFLYLSYIQSFNTGQQFQARDTRTTDTGEVRKIDLRVSDFIDATKVVLPYHRAKALTVDDKGRVYLAEGKEIEVLDADLKSVIMTLPATECDGLAVTHEGGDTVLYATDRQLCELHRFLIDTRFIGGGSPWTAAGLAGNGVMKINGAKSLRGVAVDPQGRIWMADEAANLVFRVNPDGSALASVELPKPVSIAFYNDVAFVARGTDRQIALISADMVVTGNLSVPWEELELAPYGNDRDGSLSGITVIPGGKGFYVANEHGQTANQKSTYGRSDQNSETIEGKLYTDAFGDDNEPVLRAIPVEVQDVNAAAVASSPTPTPTP